MRFDSHVVDLVDVMVALVNRTTPGYDGPRPMATPEGQELRERVVEVLVRGGRRPRVSAEEAARLAMLAVRLREVFEEVEGQRPDRAARAVNALLEETATRPRLDRSADGWAVHFHGPDDSLVIGWSAGFAAGLALALGSDLAGRLGVCAADPCDRVYVDLSKNGGRRFCSTRCQSRVKAAAHRDRQR